MLNHPLYFLLVLILYILQDIFSQPLHETLGSINSLSKRGPINSLYMKSTFIIILNYKNSHV